MIKWEGIKWEGWEDGYKVRVDECLIYPYVMLQLDTQSYMEGSHMPKFAVSYFLKCESY